MMSLVVLRALFMLITAAQGLITEIVSSIFQIESGYFGTILSNLAKVRVDQQNESYTIITLGGYSVRQYFLVLYV